MISYFPDAYPDELFYSLCARFKASMCYPSYEVAVRVLFGPVRTVPMGDLPHHLNYFVDQLPPGCQYTIDSIISKHSLFPYYQPFLPADRVQLIRQHMMKGSGRAVHSRLGKGPAAVVPPLFLRYCPACVASERATLGECYWHRLHQAPGVIVCPRHKVFLEKSTIPTSMALRTFALHAAEEILPCTSPRPAIDHPSFSICMYLARNIKDLLETPLPTPEREFWKTQYAALLAQRGYMTFGGLVRSTELLQKFVQTFSPELLSQLGCKIDIRPHRWNSWLTGLRGTLPSAKHPLFHLLFLYLLEIGVTSFFGQQYKLPPLFGEGPWPCENPVCCNYKRAVITTYVICKPSHHRQPIGQFSCACGFTYSRRQPDGLPGKRHRYMQVIAHGEVWENKLCELWSDPSISLKEICRRLGRSRTTINLQARRLELPIPRSSEKEYPNLSKAAQAVLRKDLSWYRQQWSSLLKAHPEANRSGLNRLSSNVYSWLRRHDRTWLNQHLPPLQYSGHEKRSIASIIGSSALQGASRQTPNDDTLAAGVREMTAQLLASADRPVRISKRRLLQAIPALMELKSAWDQFPLTTQAINECQETYENCALRRIHWTLQHYCEERVCPSRWQFEDRAGIRHKRKFPIIHQAEEEALHTLELLRGHVFGLPEV